MLGAIVSVSGLVLASIWLIGVERVAKIPVFGYVAKRFSAFFNPFKDLSGSGHQLANSYYAMSNGGWFGLGLGNSIKKRGYLPEAHTDFIFLKTCILIICLPPIKVATAITDATVINHKPQAFLKLNASFSFLS